MLTITVVILLSFLTFSSVAVVETFKLLTVQMQQNRDTHTVLNHILFDCFSYTIQDITIFIVQCIL